MHIGMLGGRRGISFFAAGAGGFTDERGREGCLEKSRKNTNRTRPLKEMGGKQN